MKPIYAHTLGWLLVGLLACALIVVNTAALRSDTDFEELGAYRRLWSDLARGVTTYLDREYPVAPTHFTSMLVLEPKLVEA